MKRILTLLLALIGTATACTQSHKAAFTSQNQVQFAQTIAADNTQLVDVRTPAEYAAGHIPGARNINLGAEDFDLQTATLDKTHPVALYCRSGARSKTAARRLAEQGYTVYELNDGINSWSGKTVK